jgi:heat-inducible transcriptional repressor
MKEGLSKREREILREVVDLYLASGEPVASAALARASRTGLSPASLRNVMAELEDKGFLIQPHTSAGRVPTDLGSGFTSTASFRALCSRNVTTPAQGHAPARGPLEEVLAQVSRVLADVTTEVGMRLRCLAAGNSAVGSLREGGAAARADRRGDGRGLVDSVF